MKHVLQYNAGDSGSTPGWGRPPGEGIGYPLQHVGASLMAQMVKKKKKNPPAMGEPGFDPWVGKIPSRKARLPTPLFCPEGCTFTLM